MLYFDHENSRQAYLEENFGNFVRVHFFVSFAEVFFIARNDRVWAILVFGAVEASLLMATIVAFYSGNISNQIRNFLLFLPCILFLLIVLVSTFL